MVGLIDVGGGMRDIFGAGVIDYFMENGIDIDTLLGVSAGSANLMTYKANQPGRSYLAYMEYSFRKEYMSAKQFLKKGSYIDLDYAYGTLMNDGAESPLDYDTFSKSDKRIVVVATDAITGRPVYFTEKDIKRNNYDVLKASSCVPWVNKPYRMMGSYFYDGGISDPIPVEKAFELGCDKVVIILTRPKDFRRDPKKDEKIAKLVARNFPRAARLISDRAFTYNIQLDEAISYEKEGKVLILAPDTIDGMSTLTKDKEAMQHMYEQGREKAKLVEDFLKS